MAENNSNSSNSDDENQNLGSCIQNLSEEEGCIEKKFKNRFTEEDEEFQKLVATTIPIPPFVYPWDARPPRQRGNWNQNQRNRRDDNRDGNHGRNRDERWGRRDNQSSSNSYRDREDRRSSYDRPSYHDNRRHY